jgi:hypothetical protein
METRVAILTGHSLLADGLISRLREYAEQLELQVFDIEQANVLSQITAFHPLALILEENKSGQAESCSLKSILTALPNTLVIYLGLGDDDIHVIQSEQHHAGGVQELLEIIRPTTEKQARLHSKPADSYIRSSLAG